MVKGMISEWFLRYKDFKNWFGLGMPPGHPSSLGFQISNLSAKLYINIISYQNFFRTFPSVVSENKSKQNLDCFGHASGPALESSISNFKTLLHNFKSISTTSPNFRTIRPVVTEISAGQNFGRKKKRKKKQQK